MSDWNFYRLFMITIQRGVNSERSSFAHISTTGSLTDFNKELASGNIGFIKVLNFP